MNEALCSILCGEDEWRFDGDGRTIKFNNNGTGELWCRCNYNCWIAAELEWKSILLDPIEPAAGPIKHIFGIGNAIHNTSRPDIQLGLLNLEITLTKRLPPIASMLSKSTMVNELSLTDDAFLPKRYIIELEKGNFREPCTIGSPNRPSQPRFALRLIFDQSPYPPQSQWKASAGNGPISGQFWNHKEFVARESSELKKQGKAMNESALAGWGNSMKDVFGL